MAGLTPKQAMFVKEYLIDLNATQAAIRAGYSEKTAYRTGADNLKKPQIAAAIQSAMKKREEKTEITAERVILELAKLAFSNIGDVARLGNDGMLHLDFSEATPEQMAAITEIQSEVYMEGYGDDAVPVKRNKVKFASKQNALEALGRHLSIFNDKLDLNVQGDVVALIQAGRKRVATAKGGDDQG